MKAILINEQGPAEVMKVAEVPDPEPAAGEVLVELHAASVNPADTKVRGGGHYTRLVKVIFPYCLGRDFSGIVKACGDGVTEFQPGDAVFGVLPAGIEGTYCEMLTVDASVVARKPDWLKHEEAAALTLTGLTALVSIEDTLKLKPGEKILIHAGAGGVGSFAVQLAKYIGAHVITTASPANHEYVRGLGADEIIDYNAQDFTEVLSDLDAVFDLIGFEVHQRSFSVLKPGGRIAYIAPLLEDAKPPRDDVTVYRPNVARDRAHQLRILDLVSEEAIKLPEIKTMPWLEVVEAHKLIETGHVRGKIVLMMK